MKELLEEGKASQGSLPVNVAFAFEGEEENGSVGFEEAIQGNLHWFEGTQLIVISNTLWVGERVPCLTYGAFLKCFAFASFLRRLVEGFYIAAHSKSSQYHYGTEDPVPKRSSEYRRKQNFMKDLLPCDVLLKRV